MANLMSNKDQLIAKDIANTIIHFRRECGCFPTTELMRKAIHEETTIRPLDNKAYAEMMVQDIIIQNKEWFAKIS